LEGFAKKRSFEEEKKTGYEDQSASKGNKPGNRNGDSGYV
jgi:hypothetical protein